MSSLPASSSSAPSLASGSWSTHSSGVLDSLHASAVAHLLNSTAIHPTSTLHHESESKRPRGRPRKRPRVEPVSGPPDVTPTLVFPPPETLIDPSLESASQGEDDDWKRLQTAVSSHARRPGQVLSHDEARMLLQIYWRAINDRMSREGLPFKSVRTWGVTYTHRVTGVGYETVRKVVNAAATGGELYAEDVSKRGGGAPSHRNAKKSKQVYVQVGGGEGVVEEGESVGLEHVGELEMADVLLQPVEGLMHAVLPGVDDD